MARANSVQAAASGDPMAAGDPFAELLGYFAALVERRRSYPGEDIVSDLTALGEDTVTTARILGFAFTMVTGGNDTITGMLSGSACLLAEHPDQRAKLIANPALIHPADGPFDALLAFAKTGAGLWLVSRALIPAGEGATLRIAALAAGLGAIFADGVVA